MSLVVESNVTAIMGANDHGKSNILKALTHLNPDIPFERENDLNWDSAKEPEKFPKIRAKFKLSVEEKDQLKLLADKHSMQANPAQPEPNVAKLIKQGASVVRSMLDIDVTVDRTGVDGTLHVEENALYPKEIYQTFVLKNLPRFELIRPWEKIEDSVSAGDIETNDFMRGIFYYAGLDPEKSKHLFSQDDSTSMELETASDELTNQLRARWSQGADLGFVLRHNSNGGVVELRIKDPTVQSRFVRPSRRSSGFTHYFAIKTILNARQHDHVAGSYVLMFDEPGIFLHPAGQQDLLQVLEILGKQNQVLYVTHSLLMINKNYPLRHRLVYKDGEGTKLDGKPYANQWGRALSTIGWSTTGTILFANYVVLTEGDSDPIYLTSSWQYLLKMGAIKADLNSVAFVSTGESRNADFIVQMLGEGKVRPKMLAVFDGDAGGAERKKAFQALATRFSVQIESLPHGDEIEDVVPQAVELIPIAASNYLKKVFAPTGDAEKQLEAFCREKYLARKKGENKIGINEWLKQCSKSLGQDGSVSKSGVAREFATLLQARGNSENNTYTSCGAEKLLRLVIKALVIPEIAKVEQAVLRSAP